jgi:Na+/melibiose symporter-like transporter
LLVAFGAVERRSPAPLVPLRVFRRRTFTAANVVSALLWAAFFATIFEGTLWFQQALGYSAVETGVAWLASTVSSLVVAGAVAPRFVGRFGASTSLVVGQLLVTGGLLSLTTVPVDAAYWTDVFPGLLAFGLGLGFSIMAVQVAAFAGVDESTAGLAGGMIETSREIGGALGVAVVATIAVARVDDVLASAGSGPAATTTALTEGFQRATLVAAGLSLLAATAAGLLLRPAERAAATTGAPETTPTVAAAEPALAVSDEIAG